MEYLSIPSIVVICYLFAEILKVVTFKNEVIKRLIPFLAGTLGGVLGCLIFRYYESFINATNYFEACAIGITSGLASTGTNQIIKQLLKGENKNESEFF